MVRRGDLWMCDFGDPVGHEPGYRHPAVVVSATQFNARGIMIVVPITKTRRGYPTHVELDGPLPLVSYAQCELIGVVAEERLLKPLGSVNGVYLDQIGVILRRLLGL